MDNDLAARLERLVNRLDACPRSAGDWRKRLLGEFLSGVARGLGFSVGFTLLGAMLVLFLRNAALANLPGIGRFLAELVRIVERNL